MMSLRSSHSVAVCVVGQSGLLFWTKNEKFVKTTNNLMKSKVISAIVLAALLLPGIDVRLRMTGQI